MYILPMCNTNQFCVFLTQFQSYFSSLEDNKTLDKYLAPPGVLLSTEVMVDEKYLLSSKQSLVLPSEMLSLGIL